MPFLYFAFAVAALYCLTAAVCIANRMDCNTRWHRRLLVVVLGVLALWALLRTVTEGWPPSPSSLVHLAALSGATVYLLFNPRVPT